MDFVPFIALTAVLGLAIIASLLPDQKIGLYGSQHIHADFLVQIEDQILDFSLPKYQSTNEHPRSPLVHLHDGNGNVIHIHATGITWRQVFQALGFSLNASCIGTDTGNQYCTNATQVFRTYVNNHYRADLSRALVRDLDRAVFVYYPRNEEHKLNKALRSVSIDACIASQKCQERGMPEPEAGCIEGDCFAGEQ